MTRPGLPPYVGSCRECGVVNGHSISCRVDLIVEGITRGLRREGYLLIEASHHAELVSERDALAKRVSDLEADCDSYAKTFGVIDEQANAEANKLVHHAELVEALRQMRDHPACPVQVGVIGDAVLAKIGGGR